jgi:hypothetical protein
MAGFPRFLFGQNSMIPDQQRHPIIGLALVRNNLA